MAYRLFLFDLDGTLIDTSPGILQALRATEEELCIPPLPQATLEKFIGPPLEWSYETYYGVDAATAKVYANTYRRLYLERDCVTNSRLYPYVKETLELIRAQGAKCAVTSLKMETMVGTTLGTYDLAPYFDAIVGRSERCHTKADTIREAMRLIGWEDPAAAVLLGDSRYDGEGAAEAGVAFVPLTYGFGFSEPEALQGLACVTVANNPRDVYDFAAAQFDSVQH